MKEDRTMDKIHKGLVKKFHTLCSELALTGDERIEMLSSYGVDSSVDMDTHDLINLCAKLSESVNNKIGAGDMNKLRKRVIASIGAYLRSTNQEGGISKIKGIACRATKHNDFNKIPRERLRNLIYLFNNKLKDKKIIQCITNNNDTNNKILN